MVISNPYLAGAGAALEVGGSIYGALEGSRFAKQKAEQEKAIARLEIEADKQRRDAMDIQARRGMLQNVRNAQQAQANALSSAVGSGAQFSSSAQSGQRQAGAEAAYGNLGISQNLQIGEKLFDINEQIDYTKMSEADTESKQATAMGIGSAFTNIGKSLMNFGA
jgi:hypothetical protein